MTLPLILFVTAGLLLVVGLIQPLAAKLQIPASVLLAVVGIVLGGAAAFFLFTEVTDALNEIALAILQFPIDSQLFLYIFLPTLLFQTSMTLDLRRIAEDAAPIFVLAVLAVLAATAVIGFSLAAVSSQSLIACLLLGAIVATTDPIAVVAIFREIGAPGRLGRLIEGESLLNDAAAITLTTLFLGLLISGQQVGVGDVAWGFVRSFIGGAVVGYVAAFATALLFGAVRDDRFSQATLSLALPYLAYIAAEQGFHVSGVIAVFVAGLTLNVIGPSRSTPTGWSYMLNLWEQLGFWAGSLVFLLASVLIPQILQGLSAHDLWLLIVLIAGAFVARALILFIVMPALTALKLSQPVSARFKIVILWGGLRGAVTLALALAVTENPLVPEDTKRFVAVLATGFVLFTLLIQGTTTRPLINLLGLNRLSPLDRALRNQALAVALENVREAVERTAEKYQLPPPVAWEVARSYAERVNRAAAAAADGGEVADRDRIRLGLVSLAGRERELILEHFGERTVSMGIVRDLLTNAGRLLEAARAGGRLDYLRAARGALGFSWRFRAAQLMHRWFGLNKPLQNLVANRFELVLINRLILDALIPFVSVKISPVLGLRVGEILEEILGQRRESTMSALEALRLQYPDYAAAMERRFLRKTALRREELEYQLLAEDRLIGDELARELRQGIIQARKEADLRPKLDLGLKTREVVANFPLFAGFSPAELDEVSARLTPQFAAPGTRLIQKGERGDEVFFISSGAVEVNAPSGKIRLGRGDFFGELALLTRRRRQTDVTAIAYCSLLVLSERDFRTFLAEHPDLRLLMARVAAERLRMNEEAERNGSLPEEEGRSAAE